MDEIIRSFLNKDLDSQARLHLLDELYWLDWEEAEDKYPDLKQKILDFLQEDDFSLEELALIIKLYNNPGGDLVDDYSKIISNIYERDRIKFLKALNLEKEEIGALVYLFRNNKVFDDENLELKEVSSGDDLSEEEMDTAINFYRSYEQVCNT